MLFNTTSVDPLIKAIVEPAKEAINALKNENDSAFSLKNAA